MNAHTQCIAGQVHTGREGGTQGGQLTNAQLDGTGTAALAALTERTDLDSQPGDTGRELGHNVMYSQPDGCRQAERDVW